MLASNTSFALFNYLKTSHAKDAFIAMTIGMECFFKYASAVTGHNCIEDAGTWKQVFTFLKLNTSLPPHRTTDFSNLKSTSWMSFDIEMPMIQNSLRFAQTTLQIWSQNISRFENQNLRDCPEKLRNCPDAKTPAKSLPGLHCLLDNRGYTGVCDQGKTDFPDAQHETLRLLNDALVANNEIIYHPAVARGHYTSSGIWCGRSYAYKMLDGKNLAVFL